MKLTARDRKLATALIPLVVLAAYWFLLMSPKRQEVTKAGDALEQQEAKRDEAQARVAQLTAAKANFGKEYEAVVRLGKAIPSTVDMPSLIVQLDRAAGGSHIRFDKITVGERSSASGQGGAPASGAGAQPEAAGGQPGAQPPSGPEGNAAAGGPEGGTSLGKATETAGNTTNDANAKSSAAAGTQGATPPGSGGSAEPPAQAGAAPQGAGASPAPGLDSVPLEFTFTGTFFDLTDFLHELKRFVKVANDQIVVRGRLMTIDSFTFSSDQEFPKLKADVKATVYLSPKAEGPTGGATPAGPPAGAGSTQADSNGAPAPPTAAVTP